MFNIFSKNTKPKLTKLEKLNLALKETNSFGLKKELTTSIEVVLNEKEIAAAVFGIDCVIPIARKLRDKLFTQAITNINYLIGDTETFQVIDYDIPLRDLKEETITLNINIIELFIFKGIMEIAHVIMSFAEGDYVASYEWAMTNLYCKLEEIQNKHQDIYEIYMDYDLPTIKAMIKYLSTIHKIRRLTDV